MIVDGPGFCYQIHQKCLSRTIAARNSFEAAPLYGELGEAAIEWLNGIQDSGAVM